jgi:hypothetical protein
VSRPTRIVALEWMDLYTFDEREITVRCPDCDKSGTVENVWTALVWVDQHQRECEA